MVPKRSPVAFVTLGLVVFSLFSGLALAGQPGPPPVDPLILEQMAASPDGTAGFFVLFEERADLAAAVTVADWAERGRFVRQALVSTADRSQAEVRRWLGQRGIAYTALPIQNALFLNADRATLEVLSTFPHVAGFRGNHRYPLEPPPAGASQAFPTGLAWNIAQVGADRVWSDFGAKGQGIVVANIDTGVDYTHDALFVNYRCGSGPHTSCWYDPSDVCGGEAPCDNNGHGTHTMGTMVGDDDPGLMYNVGMAPDAKWIACKGCEDYYCTEYALLACADWILAPDNDPANRPHVVNNSWGGGGCDTWYQASVQAWRAAGIFPAFSAGNNGSYCDSLGSPGDLPESFASGATDAGDNVAYFSSRGPSCFGEVKPEVTAPGVSVCSSVPGNGWNCDYSGTSMASPHSAGLVALLWSADPILVGDISATEYAITSTAACRSDVSCGGEACHNDVYGWGRIDAYAAVERVASSGTLRGTVTDVVTAAPLAAVTIVAERVGGGSTRASTGPAGTYTLTLPAATYTVSASLYAYYPQTSTGVVIITDATTVRDFQLQPKPRFVVSGTVSEAGTSAPLAARLVAAGERESTTRSDPTTGFYSLTLVEGAYTLRASALLHLSQRTALEVTHNQTASFTLVKSTGALLVDDDANRPDVRAFYTSTLDDLGVSYRVWDVATSGPPVAEDLLANWLVLWWTGEDGGEVLRAGGEALLGGYLDARGNLLLSSQDYLAGSSGSLTPFQSAYLHVTPYFSPNTGQTDPLGNAGDPIGSGLGPYLLVPPPGWEGQFRTDDVTDDGHGGASSPFRWQGTGEDNSTDYDGGSFKTVFLAWPLEGLAGPAGRRAVLGAVLEFFGGVRPAGLLLGRVTDANTGAGLAGAAVVPVPEGGTAEASPQGWTGPGGNFTFTLPAGSYELTVYLPGYEPEIVAGVVVTAGEITDRDIGLRAPMLEYAPASFLWSLLWEGTTSDTLVLGNAGTAGPLEWSAFFVPVRGTLLPRTPARSVAGFHPADRPPASGEQEKSLAQPLSWESDTPLPSGRLRSASFVAADGAIFVVGGWESENQNLRYDPTSGTWQAMAPLPVARSNVQAGVVDGVAYIPGGYSPGGAYESSLEAYDIAADAWIPGRAPLPEPRAGAMVAAVGGKVYACGGNGYPTTSDTCWAYLPSADGWETVAPLPEPNAYGIGFEYDGYFYVVGGIGAGANAFWRYDPVADAWEIGPPLYSGRMSPGVTVYGQSVYVFAGGGNGDIWSPYATVERYDLAQWPGGGWEPFPDSLPVAVVAPANACTTGRARVIGGYDGWGPRAEHQALDEGLPCYVPGEQEQLPWLTLEPVSGSLAVGQQQTVTLRVDAGVVRDPMCYEGRLSIQDNTVYPESSIPLTLCVAPTPDLGKLQGTVRGLGYCDQDPQYLRTTVLIEGSGGITWSVSTDSEGLYYQWLHAGAYSVTVGAAGNITQTHTVQVLAAQTTTLDVDLRYLTRCLEVAPRAVTVYAPPGTQVHLPLTVADGGPVSLNWEAREAIIPEPFFGSIGSLAQPANGVNRSGGPDPFGYTYLDSREGGGPSYAWLDIAIPGTELPIDYAVYYATYTLPFSFTLYGVLYPPTTTVKISPNGTLYFQYYDWLYNSCLPQNVAALAVPFHDWLNPGALYAAVLGTAPHRMFVVEWHDMLVDPYVSLTDTVTLEAILFEGTNDILFQYQDATSSQDSRSGGASADVGIQGDLGDNYLAYSCDEPALADSLAICFEPPAGVPGCGVWWEDLSWLQLTPTAGYLPGDGQQALDLALDTTNLQEGVYRGALGFYSDDPRRPYSYVPVTLVVGLEQRIYLPLVARSAAAGGR